MKIGLARVVSHREFLRMCGLAAVGAGIGAGQMVLPPKTALAADATYDNLYVNVKQGIGTTVPNEKLVVYGTGIRVLVGPITTHTVPFAGYDNFNTTVLEINCNGTGTSSAAQLSLSNNIPSSGQIGTINWYNTALGSEKRLAAVSTFTDGANNSGAVRFYIASAGAFVERARIDNLGNITVNGVLAIKSDGVAAQAYYA